MFCVMDEHVKHRKRYLGKKRRKKCVEFISDLKKMSTCLLCGAGDDLTFHHRDQSAKKANVNYFVKRKSMGALINEISKCDIVCLDCHRYLHREYLHS